MSVRQELEAKYGKPAQTTQPATGSVRATLEAKYKAPETRESRIQQGLPVSSGSRFRRTGAITPSGGGSLVRDALRTPARLVATGRGFATGVKELARGEFDTPTQMYQPTQSKYFGNLDPIGARGGQQLPPGRELLDALGAGAELGSFVPVGTGTKLAAQVLKQPFKQAIKTTAKAFGREGIIQGALGSAGRSMQDGDTFGETLGKTAVGATVGGLAGATIGVGTQTVSRAFTKTPVEAIKQRAVEATSKALGISGKRPIKQASVQPEQYTRGLSTVRKYADNFDPKNSDNIFDDTVKGLITAKDKVFQTYNNIAQQAGDAGVSVDTNPLQASLVKYVSGITTAPKKQRAIRLLKELQDNFPNGKASPLEMQQYIKLLNEELGGIAGGAERGAVGVVSDFTKQARESLDTAVGRLGKEYQSFKDEYASLKAIEDSLVRQYQKVMRKKGSGLGEYADMISSAEVLNGIISGNPALIAKGGLMRVLSSKIKSLNDPETWLKRAFDEIDKAGDAFTPQARNRASQLQLPARSSSLNTQITGASTKPIVIPRKLQSVVDANIGKSTRFSNNEVKDFSETLVGKANEAEAGAMEQVIAEMLELSEAGKRVMRDDGTFMAQTSTFPKWLPEDLRSMELFERVVEKVNNGATRFGVREARLLQAMEKRANFYKRQMIEVVPQLTKEQEEFKKMVGGDIAFAAVPVAGTGGLLQRIKEKREEKKQASLPKVSQKVTQETPSFDRKSFSNRIAGIENEALVGQPDKMYKSVGVSGDLGKYQVSPQSLQDWSKAWLNKEYTKQEFLNDPQAQEKFFNNFLDVVERLKLNPEEAAVTWHRGWGLLGQGNKTREQRDKEFREYLSKEMQSRESQNYLEKFNG